MNKKILKEEIIDAVHDATDLDDNTVSITILEHNLDLILNQDNEEPKNYVMKMYYFNPNDYGEEFFVMAENKIKAHEYLIKYLEKKVKEEIVYKASYIRKLDLWKNVNPLDITTFPKGTTLDEHEVGSVIESEIA